MAFPLALRLPVAGGPIALLRRPENNADSYAILVTGTPQDSSNHRFSWVINLHPALYLDKWDWSTGEVDTETQKTIPQPSLWQKVGENVWGATSQILTSPAIDQSLHGKDNGSPLYWGSLERYVGALNPNRRRKYRNQVVKVLVQRRQIPLKVAICVAVSSLHGSFIGF